MTDDTTELAEAPDATALRTYVATAWFRAARMYEQGDETAGIHWSRIADHA